MDPIHDFTSIPEGTYRVRIDEVRERQTRDGHTLWSLRLVVVDGDYQGRTAAWDDLVFSPRGAVRVNLVLKALGISPNAFANIGADDLVGLAAIITVRATEYFDSHGGLVRRNEVPYDDGWRAIS